MISRAIFICKALLLATLVGIALFVGVWLHWMVDPMAYVEWEVVNDPSAAFTMDRLNICNPCTNGADPIGLNELPDFIRYWILFRMLFFSVLFYLFIRKILEILTSMQSINTFYEGNIGYFKSLSRYAIFGWVVSCISFSFQDGRIGMTLQLNFGLLLFAIACSLLSEVFKEGKILLDDKNMII